MKIYLKNKEAFINFVQIYKNEKINVLCNLDEPNQYPCILIWGMHTDIIKNKNAIHGEYVYLDDFKNN